MMMACATRPRRDDRPHTARRGEAGFTLLEIMVAMVVLSMIVTTSFGALRLADRSWEAGLARSNESETLRAVAALLQRQFKQALPLSWSEDKQTTIAFNGAREQLRFIAPAPQHHGATGLFEYTLVAEADETSNSTRLLLYYRLHDPGSAGFAPDGSDRQRVLLVDALQAASFDYYGSPVADDPPRWHTQWNDDADAFPLLVRARLVNLAEQRPWPELVLALHAELAK
jgi:general secretion pathway protein J